MRFLSLVLLSVFPAAFFVGYACCSMYTEVRLVRFAALLPLVAVYAFALWNRTRTGPRLFLLQLLLVALAAGLLFASIPLTIGFFPKITESTETVLRAVFGIACPYYVVTAIAYGGLRWLRLHAGGRHAAA